MATQFNWKQQGDVVNLIVVINSLVYLVYFLMAHSGLAYMDPPTLRDGFCITNPTDPLWNSHMLSFYADCFLSGVCVLVVLLTSADGGSSRDFLSRSIPGTLGHGLGHLFFALNSNSITDKSGPLYMYVLAVPVLLFFWYSLLGSNKYIPKRHLILNSLAHTLVLMSPLMTTSAGFTYVQTVLVLTFNFYDTFFRPTSAKDIAYDWVGFVSIPFSIVAWLEATSCERFLKSVGGHMWYDASIPIAILVYYFAIRHSRRRPSESDLNEAWKNKVVFFTNRNNKKKCNEKSDLIM